jgi:hypothetical protein
MSRTARRLLSRFLRPPRSSSPARLDVVRLEDRTLLTVPANTAAWPAAPTSFGYAEENTSFRQHTVTRYEETASRYVVLDVLAEGSGSSTRQTADGSVFAASRFGTVTVSLTEKADGAVRSDTYTGPLAAAGELTLPFAVPDREWVKVTTRDEVESHARGYYNSSSLAYAYATSVGHDMTTTVRPAAPVANGTVTVAAETTGTYFSRQSVYDWAHAPEYQGKNTFRGEFATDGTVLTDRDEWRVTYADGAAVTFANEPRLELRETGSSDWAMKQTITQGDAPYDRVDGIAEREHKSTWNRTATRGGTMEYGLKAGVVVPTTADDLVARDGTLTAFDGTAGSVELDRFRQRADYQFRTRDPIADAQGRAIDTRSTGYVDVESKAFAGDTWDSRNRQLRAANGAVVSDWDQTVSSYQRHEAHTYDAQDVYQTWTWFSRQPGVGYGSETAGTRLAFRTASSDAPFTDSIETTVDSAAGTVSQVGRRDHNGRTLRSESDRGSEKTTYGADPDQYYTTDYDDSTDLTGRFRDGFTQARTMSVASGRELAAWSPDDVGPPPPAPDDVVDRLDADGFVTTTGEQKSSVTVSGPRRLTETRSVTAEVRTRDTAYTIEGLTSRGTQGVVSGTAYTQANDTGKTTWLYTVNGSLGDGGVNGPLWAETVNHRHEVWRDVTANVRFDRVTFNGGVPTEVETVGSVYTGGTSIDSTRSRQDFVPREKTRTERTTGTGTFDGQYNANETHVDGELTAGELTDRRRKTSRHTSTINTREKLDVAGKQEGWDTAEYVTTVSDRSPAEDVYTRQVADGEWTALVHGYNDAPKVETRYTVTHELTTYIFIAAVDPRMQPPTAPVRVGQSTDRTEDVGIILSEDDRRGRTGPNAWELSRNLRHNLNVRTHTVRHRQSDASGPCSIDVRDVATDLATLERKYATDGGAKRLTWFDNTERHDKEHESTSLAEPVSDGYLRVWGQSGSTQYRHMDGTPQEWTGSTIDHAWSKTDQRKVDGTGAVAWQYGGESETGSEEPTPIHGGYEPSTWYGVLREDFSDTWMGRNFHTIGRVAAGVGELGVGLMAAETPAGWLLIAAGVDELVAAARGVAAGRPVRTGAEEAVLRLTGSHTAAILVPMAASLGAGLLARGAAAARLPLTEDIGGLAIIAGKRYDSVVAEAVANLVKHYPGIQVFTKLSELSAAARPVVWIVSHGHLTIGGPANTINMGGRYISAYELAQALNRFLPNHVAQINLVSCLAGQTRWFGLRPSYAYELSLLTGRAVIAPKGICNVDRLGRLVVRYETSDGAIWLPNGFYRFDSWWNLWGGAVR